MVNLEYLNHSDIDKEKLLTFEEKEINEKQKGETSGKYEELPIAKKLEKEILEELYQVLNKMIRKKINDPKKFYKQYNVAQRAGLEKSDHKAVMKIVSIFQQMPNESQQHFVNNS